MQNHILVGVACVLLLLPSAWLLWFGLNAMRLESGVGSTRWIVFRRRMRILTILSVPAWVAFLSAASNGSAALVPLSTFTRVVVPFTVFVVAAQLIAGYFDRIILELRWTTADLIRLSVWNSLSLPVPLLLLAIAFDFISARPVVSAVLVICAGVTSLIATVALRFAEGFRPRQVKSGDLYKRSLAMSRRMGVSISRVSVVPFGRGRLTNAFAGASGIALTDDYGRWLHGSQLDFVIGHELAHVQLRHGIRKLTVIVGTVLPSLVLVLLLAPDSPFVQFALRFVVVLGPLLVYYCYSRRCEYAADRAAVAAIDDGAVGIQALSSLYRHVGVPVRCSIVEEIFSTHPSALRRMAEIAVRFQVSTERIPEVGGLGDGPENQRSR